LGRLRAFLSEHRRTGGDEPGDNEPPDEEPGPDAAGGGGSFIHISIANE
jgi:hypothetical protein